MKMGKPVKHDCNILIPVWLLGSFPNPLRVTSSTEGSRCTELATSLLIIHRADSFLIVFSMDQKQETAILCAVSGTRAEQVEEGRSKTAINEANISANEQLVRLMDSH